MRTINIPVEVTENVTVEKVAVREGILEYKVNKKSQFISVKTELIAEDGSVVGQEDFYFEGEDYKSNPVEYDLWQLIDKQRGEKI